MQKSSYYSNVKLLRNYNSHIQKHNFTIPFAENVCYGIESILYLGPNVSDIIPISIKNDDSVKTFGELIKKCVLQN